MIFELEPERSAVVSAKIREGMISLTGLLKNRVEGILSVDEMLNAVVCCPNTKACGSELLGEGIHFLGRSLDVASLMRVDSAECQLAFFPLMRMLCRYGSKTWVLV